MPNSPLLDLTQATTPKKPRDEAQNMESSSPLRIARAAILNGAVLPATTVAQLEAQGVNVGELESRLRDSIGFRA